MSNIRRIGILTGGGDVPGLNPVIKSVVYQSTGMGYEVLGIRRGWEGLTHMRPGPELDPSWCPPARPCEHARNRSHGRGTMLHTSRTNPAKMRRANLPGHVPAEKLDALKVGEDRYDLTGIVVLDNIAHLGLDYLIVDRRRRHA